MDIGVVKNFLAERLSTKEAVEQAAVIAGVSVATMYRYKSNPEGIGLGVLKRLADHLGLPLAHGAAWGRTDILASERRRLVLEQAVAKARTKRLVTVAPYTVNDELPEVTRLLLEQDYGTRAAELSDPILGLRAERAALYHGQGYESWEIWNAAGYRDFFHGRGRFSVLSETIRKKQVDRFVESSSNDQRKRFFLNSFELPMFGTYSSPGIVLIRIDDIHIEFQDPALVSSFEDTFNDLLTKCGTKSTDDFVGFLKCPPVGV